jgi:hypothetical protein
MQVNKLIHRIKEWSIVRQAKLRTEILILGGVYIQKLKKIPVHHNN